MQPFFLAGYGLLALGGFVCALNFYLSFLRYPLYRLDGLPFRWVSGLPLVGSLFVVLGLCWLPLPTWVFWLAVVLAGLDTGGLHWFVGSQLWHWLFPPSAPPNHALQPTAGAATRKL